MKTHKTTQIPLFEHRNVMGRSVEIARMPRSASEFTPPTELPDVVGKKPNGKHPPLVIGWRFDRREEK